METPHGAHRIDVRGEDVLRPSESPSGTFKSETVWVRGPNLLWVPDFTGRRNERHTLLQFIGPRRYHALG